MKIPKCKYCMYYNEPLESCTFKRINPKTVKEGLHLLAAVNKPGSSPPEPYTIQDICPYNPFKKEIVKKVMGDDLRKIFFDKLSHKIIQTKMVEGMLAEVPKEDFYIPKPR